MKLVVDADACPVTELAVKAAQEAGIPCILVCDSAHCISYTQAETILVDTGADSADLKVANLLEKGDIAITQDYGLAALCLSKQAKVLNQNGLIYTDQNIDNLLLSRHIHKKARMSGERTKGPSKRTKKNNQDFLASLRLLLLK